MASKIAKKLAIVGAAVTFLGGAAAILSNINLLVTKPREIAEAMGIIKPKPVSVSISLADFSEEEQFERFVGKDFYGEEFVNFQSYSLKDGRYCLAKGPVANCISGAVSIQEPAMTTIFSEWDGSGSSFASAIPFFNVMSVRPDQRDILLTSQGLEYELVEPDHTPYTEILGLDNNEGRVNFVVHTTDQISKVELKYDIRDVVFTGQIDAWYHEHRRSAHANRFRYSKQIKAGAIFGKVPSDDNFAAFFNKRVSVVDFRSDLERHFTGARFTNYSREVFGEPDPSTDNKWLSGVKPTWKSSDSRLHEEMPKPPMPANLAVMLEGEMVVTATQGATYRSHFVTPIIVSSEKGYGAADGGVDVDSTLLYIMPANPQTGSIIRPVQLVLNAASPTIRTHAAVMFPRSGMYKIRFVYSSNDTKEFMASEWVEIQAYSSPFFSAFHKLRRQDQPQVEDGTPR